MTFREELKEYLISSMRASVIAAKSNENALSKDNLNGQTVAIRYILEDFFMTREEAGQIINEAWEMDELEETA